MKRDNTRENGFSLIELMVAMGILIAVVAAVTGVLMQAQRVTTGIGLEANIQDNLRAGMHFMVRDFMQAGEGIPQSGVAIPTTAGGVSNVNRPGTATIFPNSYSTLPPVVPGSTLGSFVNTVNPVTSAVIVGIYRTDVITVLYADNTLASSAGGAAAPLLTAAPVTAPAPSVPVCAGTISATGLTVVLDAGCFTMPGQPTPIAVGNLILFHNSNGTALEYVTAVNGQTITFAGGDPANLNQTGLPNGTVAAISASTTPTTISRVWMVSYYADSVTNPLRPQLIRQVNYPNAPVAAPANPPQAVAEVIEDLQFTYDIINSTAAAGAYGANGAGDAQTSVLPDTPFNFRAVNILLTGRSEYPYTVGGQPQYLRNSLSTQVAIRSLSFTNQFNTSTLSP